MTTTPVPVTLPAVQPMLASPSKGRSLADLGSAYVYQPKVDGVRAMVRFDGHAVSITNRLGAEISDRFPEVAASIAEHAGGPLHLDGELTIPGHPFSIVNRRTKLTVAGKVAADVAARPAHFHAFDLLAWVGSDGTVREHGSRPLTERMVLLDLLAGEGLGAPRHQLGPHASVLEWSNDGPALYERIRADGGEGVIAKVKGSAYTPGVRSPLWLKFKTVQRVTCVAIGYEPGEGARAHFGAMHLAMVDVAAGKPVYVGKVGTGMTTTEITQLKAALDGGQMPVMEIETLGRTRTGQLRMPVYMGLRTDVSVVDATVSQLDSLPLS